MNSQKKTIKISRKERFRACCPEFYEQLVREKVENLPPDKQNLFFRLAVLNNELQYVRTD